MIYITISFNFIQLIHFVISSVLQTRVVIFKNICSTQMRNDVIWRVVVIRRFYWLIGGPHLHSWSNCRPDSWMNVLMMQRWFNRLDGFDMFDSSNRLDQPVGRPFTKRNCWSNCWTDRLDQTFGPTVGSCNAALVVSGSNYLILLTTVQIIVKCSEALFK